jgi:ubiquinone/menaquinone biosynthesis C-methylase UbiE
MRQTLADIRTAYDLAAEPYANKFLNELLDKPRDIELLQQFASMVGPGQRVLDLACGPGHITAHLASLGLNAVGVDLSPEMVATATRRFPTVEFTVGDFLALANHDGSVAGIIAFYCIVHLRADQLLPAFSEMFRVLNIGGVILLAFHIGTDSVRVDSFLGTGASLEFYPFLVADVHSALLAAGFTNIATYERPPYDTEYPTNRCYTFAHKPSCVITPASL